MRDVTSHCVCRENGQKAVGKSGRDHRKLLRDDLSRNAQVYQYLDIILMLIQNI